MPFAKAFIGMATQTERRSDKRLQSPGLEISLDDGSYQTKNWSLGGVLVEDYYGSLAPGDEVDGTVQLLPDTSSHPFKAVVVRRETAVGHLALSFIELSESAFALLESAMMGRYGL